MPVTDHLTVMSASAVSELQHRQPIPSYVELSSLKTGVVGDGWPGSVSHGGLLTPTGTPFRTIDTVSAGGMNDYWRQLEHLGTALSPVLAPVGGGEGAAHDSVTIAADSRDVCLTEKVSAKQTLEPASTVLSSSIITG